MYVFIRQNLPHHILGIRRGNTWSIAIRDCKTIAVRADRRCRRQHTITLTKYRRRQNVRVNDKSERDYLRFVWLSRATSMILSTCCKLRASVIDS